MQSGLRWFANPCFLMIDLNMLQNQPLEKIQQKEELYSLPSATKFGQLRKASREKALIEYIGRHLKQDAVILEIGSGRGEFAEVVKKWGYRYVGIEPANNFRQDLRERGFEIIGEPIPKINLKSESVDLVYSSAVIEHLENYSAVLDYFLEAKRVLKPGGFMCSIVPNCDSLGMIFHQYDYQHNFVTNSGRLEHLSRDTGFEVIESRSFLTNVGLSSFGFVFDRIFAHLILLFLRSPFVFSLIRLIVGNEMSLRIHKNVFDQTIVIARKPI